MMPRMASGANIPGDDGEGHGVRQTGVGSPLIPGVGCAWQCPHLLTCSMGADEGVKRGDLLSLNQKLGGQSCTTVPGAVGRGDLTLKASGSVAAQQ